MQVVLRKLFERLGATYIKVSEDCTADAAHAQVSKQRSQQSLSVLDILLPILLGCLLDVEVLMMLPCRMLAGQTD